MPVELNHTIVHATDRDASARFVADILGLDAPTLFGPFQIVQVAGVSLDFMAGSGPVRPQHYAFLVGESEFDEIFGRIRERDLDYWADPGHRRLGEINTNDGGRGVYWDDPDGHNLEILTRPYGGDKQG
ncbi:MAG: VOC family protein [Rhodococcus sp. (in: high G+C Gram-positive bacteria)]|uniref:VOC family protein n=1 Tax=Rhodococcus sp. TaxID=1831 RepID=UPI003BB5ED4C